MTTLSLLQQRTAKETEDTGTHPEKKVITSHDMYYSRPATISKSASEIA